MTSRWATLNLFVFCDERESYYGLLYGPFLLKNHTMTCSWTCEWPDRYIAGHLCTNCISPLVLLSSEFDCIIPFARFCLKSWSRLYSVKSLKWYSGRRWDTHLYCWEKAPGITALALACNYWLGVGLVSKLYPILSFKRIDWYISSRFTSKVFGDKKF